MDMCDGPILGKMLRFTLPLMASGVLQLLFNAADIVVVGQFSGDNALAAVGSTGSLVNLIVNMFVGMSVGANVVIARFYGGKNYDRLERGVHTAMLLSLISGIILTFIGIIGAEWFLTLMQTPPEVLPLATLYLRIYFGGMTATMIYNFGSAILRAVGDTRRPLYFLLLAGIVNVGLNLLFVISFGMGVAGVAIATVVSQCISAALVVICLAREEGAIRLDFKKLHIDKDEFKEMLRIGLPAGLQGTVFSISNVVIQSSINSFGPVVMAGNSAAGNIEGFVYTAMNSFYQAAISFTSQNLGAKNYKRITRSLWTSEICVTVVGIALGSLAVLFGQQLLNIYSSSPDVIQAGMYRLQVVAQTYALCGIMDVMVGGLRGIGYSVAPMFVSIAGVCGVRLLWIATVFQMPAYHNVTTVYLSYPLSWLATLVTHVVCFLILWRRMMKKVHKQELIQTR